MEPMRIVDNVIQSSRLGILTRSARFPFLLHERFARKCILRHAEEMENMRACVRVRCTMKKETGQLDDNQ